MVFGVWYRGTAVIRGRRFELIGVRRSFSIPFGGNLRVNRATMSRIYLGLS